MNRKLLGCLGVPVLLGTIIGEDHGSWARKTDNSFDKVLSTTGDFLNVYLRNDAAAKARLEKGENDDECQLVVALDRGTVATESAVQARRGATSSSTTRACGIPTPAFASRSRSNDGSENAEDAVNARIRRIRRCFIVPWRSDIKTHDTPGRSQP
jgi:hypothetical protein